MCLDDLWDRMLEYTEKDAAYQETLSRVERLEPAFLAIRESLHPEQRQILDDYIAACEALEQCEIFLAAKLSMPETCPSAYDEVKE